MTQEVEKPSIYLGFPVYNRMVDMEIMSKVFHIASLGKYKLMMELICSPYIDSARNLMVENFLKSDFEWLYFWDTDVVIQDTDFLDKLMETAIKFNAPVASATYVKKNELGEYVTLKLDGNEMPNYKLGELTEPQLITCTGAGALLIHRSVLEEMKSPYFEINPKPGGREMPEDYYFCLKVRELGYNIALDTRIETHHYGPAAWVHKYTPANLDKEKPIKEKKNSKFKKEKLRKIEMI